MSRNKNKTVTGLSIVDIGHKGMSIAKDEEGQVYLLKGGVPGDIVSALIRRKKKGMPFGDVTEIEKESIHRAEPFCEHFESCGGCKWQNLNYQQQIHLKEKQVHDAIRRLARIEEYDRQEILACESITEYRNKLEYTFSPKRWLSEEEVSSEASFADRRGLGFHLAGAFDRVLDVDKCHLMPLWHNQLRNRFRTLSKDLNIAFYDTRSHIGILRNLMIRINSAGEAMVVVIISSYIGEVLERLLNPLIKEFPQVKSWQYIVNEKLNDSLTDLESTEFFGESHIVETIGNKKFLISPLSFFQTNSRQAERLYDIVKERAQLTGKEVIYDLYCGTGSIGIYLGDVCKKVIGVEENTDAIADANLNAEMNKLNDCNFFAGDVQSVVNAEFIEENGKPDVIITDPPRAGMHADVVEFIKNIGAERIVYVSCNPATMARDIALMTDQYTLVSCKPVDMFPHTSHVESVSLLQRK